VQVVNLSSTWRTATQFW